MIPQFGIISDGLLTTSAAQLPICTAGLSSARDYFELAKIYKIRQLWVLPGSQPYEKAKNDSRGIYAPGNGLLTVVPDAPDIARNGRGEEKETLRDLITAWQNQDRVQIIFPGIHEAMPGRFESQWPLDQIADAGQLRDAIDLFIKLLWVRPSVPNRTARLIFEQTIDKKYLREGSGQNLNPFTDHKETDLIYSRKLNKAEKKLKWLHVYDKNNAYLSAAGEKMPVGNYVHINCKEKNSELIVPFFFNSKIPGLYFVEDLTGNNLPKIKGGWFYSPVLKFYESIGYLIKVRQGFIFHETFPVFEDFYKAIKSALDKLNDEEINEEIKRIVRGSIKKLYTSFFGWLNRLDYDPAHLDYYKPHWTNFIKSTAKARMLFNIHEIKKQMGIEPVAVLTDSVWYLSDEPDASAAIRYPFSGTHPTRQTPTIYKSKTYAAERVMPAFIKGDHIIHINRELKGGD